MLWIGMGRQNGKGRHFPTSNVGKLGCGRALQKTPLHIVCERRILEAVNELLESLTPLIRLISLDKCRSWLLFIEIMYQWFNVYKPSYTRVDLKWMSTIKMTAEIVHSMHVLVLWLVLWKWHRIRMEMEETQSSVIIKVARQKSDSRKWESNI